MKNILLLILFLSTGCYITSYTPDPVYEDHPHTTEVYYNGIDIYFGYHTGFYYYYGIPHYYPWWNYYHICPPYYYNTTTHIVINKPVNKPTHRPNRPTHRPTWNNNRPTINSNVNIIKPNNNNKIKIYEY